MKLGSENLGQAYAKKLDYRIAGSLSALSLRMRLKAIVELLSAGLTPQLQARPKVPLLLINIAGGPASDSLNTLIALRKSEGSLLEGRGIQVHLLDRDGLGPAFAKKSLEALQAPGFALEGLKIEMQLHSYDWHRPESLLELLGSLPTDAVWALSSEGGLFDYGTDEVIQANLKALDKSCPAQTLMAVSATRKDSRGRLSQNGVAAVLPRSMEELQDILKPGAWEIRSVKETTISYMLDLCKKRQ
jgi:hypothetical protein